MNSSMTHLKGKERKGKFDASALQESGFALQLVLVFKIGEKIIIPINVSHFDD